VASTAAAGAAITVFILHWKLGIADPVASFHMHQRSLTVAAGFFGEVRRLVRKKGPLEGGLAMTLATDDSSNNPATAGPGLVDEGSGACWP